MKTLKKFIEKTGVKESGLIAISLLILIGLAYSCNSNKNATEEKFRRIAEKAKKAGFNVTYKDSLIIQRPKKFKSEIASAENFGYGNCGLDDDTAFIEELVRNSQIDSVKNKDNSLDSIGAVKAAVAAWTPIYGKKNIESERPYNAKLKGNVWIVTGSLPEEYVGGVAYAEISRKTGEVLKTSHGK